MFPHIIENSKLIRNLQNTCKYHKTTKLTALLMKLHGPNKDELNPSHIWIKYTKNSC